MKTEKADELPINRGVSEWKLRLLLQLVSAETKIHVRDFMRKDSSAYLLLPRQLFSQIAKHYIGASLSQLGRFMERDHTTVLHYVRKPIPNEEQYIRLALQFQSQVSQREIADGVFYDEKFEADQESPRHETAPQEPPKKKSKIHCFASNDNSPPALINAAIVIKCLPEEATVESKQQRLERRVREMDSNLYDIADIADTLKINRSQVLHILGRTGGLKSIVAPRERRNSL